jgi:predicted outer membrane lipoprotein
VLLAGGVAVLHGAAVLFMLTGALLAVRRPVLLVAHAPVALAILGVNLAGADCPLTTLELELREQAGASAYGDGFLGHHVFEPLGLDVAATGTQLGVYAAAFGLNALGYGLVLTRALRRRAAAA